MGDKSETAHPSLTHKKIVWRRSGWVNDLPFTLIGVLLLESKSHIYITNER